MDRPGTSRKNKGKRKVTTPESPIPYNARAEQMHYQATRFCARPTRAVKNASEREDYVFNSKRANDHRASHEHGGTGLGAKGLTSASQERPKKL